MYPEIDSVNEHKSGTPRTLKQKGDERAESTGIVR
jgi:hypothetical protein